MRIMISVVLATTLLAAVFGAFTWDGSMGGFSFLATTVMSAIGGVIWGIIIGGVAWGIHTLVGK